LSEVLIEARNLARHYDVRRGMFAARATVKAVADVSLTVRPGRTLAIVGESGCGKSTLARMLAMIERPSSGQLTMSGTDVSDGDAQKIRKLRQFVQMVFQNPYGSLNPRQKVGAVLEEPLIITTKASPDQRRARAMEMLAKVGLRTEHYHRYPHMFSGGQRQRIAIARALMLSPKVLILDEPVSALDVSIRAQVLNLLADLKADFGLTYVLISHDLAVVRYVADPKAKRNRIRLSGELPSPINPPPGCPFHPRCRYANDRCRTEVPLSRADAAGVVACHAVQEGRI